jgi:hypothetical protein
VSAATAALALYGVGVSQESRTRRATAAVCGFLAAGVACDVIATLLMILAAGRRGLSPHGLLGYSALAAMMAGTILMWRHRRRGCTGTRASPMGIGWRRTPPVPRW